MIRPGPDVPGGEGTELDVDPGFGLGPGFAEDERSVVHLLGSIDESTPTPPEGLADRVGRRVRDRIALHDLIEIATRAFARSALLPVAERLGALIARTRSGPRPADRAAPRPPNDGEQ